MPLTPAQRKALQEDGYSPDWFENNQPQQQYTPALLGGDNQRIPESSQSSVLGATTRSAAANALPTMAGGAGLGAGMVLGNTVAAGLVGLGALESGTGVGALIGIPTGLVGAYMLSKLAAKKQQQVMPESWNKQLAIDAAQHPYATAGGALLDLPLGGFSPSAPNTLKAVGTLARLPTGVRVAAPEIQNLINVGSGAVLNPAISAGTAAITGEPMPSAGELGKEALVGALFNRPNIIGQGFGFYPPLTTQVESKAPLAGDIPVLPSTQPAPIPPSIPNSPYGMAAVGDVGLQPPAINPMERLAAAMKIGGAMEKELGPGQKKEIVAGLVNKDNIAQAQDIVDKNMAAAKQAQPVAEPVKRPAQAEPVTLAPAQVPDTIEHLNQQIAEAERLAQDPHLPVATKVAAQEQLNTLRQRIANLPVVAPAGERGLIVPSDERRINKTYEDTSKEPTKTTTGMLSTKVPAETAIEKAVQGTSKYQEAGQGIEEKEPTPGSFESILKYGNTEDNMRIIEAVAKGTKPIGHIVSGDVQRYANLIRKNNLLTTGDGYIYKNTPEGFAALKNIIKIGDSINTPSEMLRKQYGEAYGYSPEEIATFEKRIQDSSAGKPIEPFTKEQKKGKEKKEMPHAPLSYAPQQEAPVLFPKAQVSLGTPVARARQQGLAAQHGVQHAIDPNLPDTVNGQIFKENAQDTLSHLNPRTAGGDTPAHETLHALYAYMKTSKDSFFRKLTERADALFGGEEPFVQMAGERGYQKFNQDRTWANRVKEWYGDFKSQWKYKLGKANAEDMANIMSYYLIHDIGTKERIGGPQFSGKSINQENDLSPKNFTEKLREAELDRVSKELRENRIMTSRGFRNSVEVASSGTGRMADPYKDIKRIPNNSDELTDRQKDLIDRWHFLANQIDIEGLTGARPGAFYEEPGNPRYQPSDKGIPEEIPITPAPKYNMGSVTGASSQEAGSNPRAGTPLISFSDFDAKDRFIAKVYHALNNEAKAKEFLKAMNIEETPEELSGRRLPPNMGGAESSLTPEQQAQSRENNSRAAFERLAREQGTSLPPSAREQNSDKGIVETPPAKPSAQEQGEYHTSSPSIKIPFLRPEIDKIRDKSLIVADAFTKFYDDFDNLRGYLTNDIVGKLKGFLNYWNPKEYLAQNNEKLNRARQYMDDVADGKKPTVTLTPEEQQIVDVVKENNARTLELKNERPSLRNTEADEDYFQNVVSRKVIDTLLNHPNSPEAAKLIEDFYKFQKEKGATPEESRKELRDFKLGYQSSDKNLAAQFGPVDKPAGKGVPQSWREKNLIDRMARYNNRYARRIAYEDAVKSRPEVMDALTNPETGVINSEPVKNVLRDIGGQQEQIEATRSAVGGVIRAGMMGPLTGEKDFTANFSLGLQHQTPRQAIPAMVSALVNLKRGIREAFETGRNRHNIGSLEVGDEGMRGFQQLLHRVRDVMNDLQGRNFLERVTRGVAMGEGGWLGMDNIYNASRGKLSAQGKAFLDNFAGPEKWEQYRAAGEFPPDVLKRIAARYVDSVQGSYNYRGLPSLTQRGSLAPVLSLARWNVEKMNNFNKHVVTPAIRDGNYTPLLMSTVGMLIGGAAVTKLVEVVTGRKERTPKVEELIAASKAGNDVTGGILYKGAALASLSGYAGLAGDITKSAIDIYNKNRPSVAYENPLISGALEGEQYLEDIMAAIKNHDTIRVMDGISNFLSSYFQAYRVAQAQLGPETQQEIADANKRRDLKVFNQLSGYPVSEVSRDLPNDFLNKQARDFKKSQNLQEAGGILPSLIEQEWNNSHGNMMEFRKRLQALKQNSYQTIPNPNEDPTKFVKYIQYVRETQGEESAQALWADYLKRNTLNKVKSSLIPTL